MGNKCSIKKDDPKTDEILTDYDRTIYADKREKVFYGTIAICVLYASFAVLLLLASYLSEKVKYILLNNFLPFIIVYIIGTIVIVLYLIDQIVNFKAYKIDRNGNYDNLSCPDYWILEKVPNAEEDKNGFKGLFSSNVDSGLFKYRCKLDPDIFDKWAIYQANLNKGNTFSIDATTKKPITPQTGKYYQYTNTNNDNNIPTDENSVKSHDNHLFVNLLNTIDGCNVSNVYTNIFKKDNDLQYQFIVNTLFMNNYSNINYTSTENVLVFTNAINGTNNTAFGITDIKYDYEYALNTNTNIYNDNLDPKRKNIKVDIKDKKDIKVYASTNELATIVDTGNSPPDKRIYNLPLICDNTYPMLMAQADNVLNKTDNKYDNNIHRCAYSKICKVPWSDMNCDKYDN